MCNEGTAAKLGYVMWVLGVKAAKLGCNDVGTGV